ncbi:MAG TPA: cyclic nucleotide-binding domain-containing protein [Candidatus Saccharimonadia bacterium]|nr:cyclic nucleotide-binding domain-containing protein [Candidatus Saccharimonadia bacterium]
MASLSPLLSNFPPEDVAQLSIFGEARHYVSGETIIGEGEVNNYLYLILKGTVEVVKKGDHGNHAIAEITQTGSIGEMSIFDPGPSSATVRATTEVEVWRATQENLERMHEVRPKVAYRLVTRICEVLAKRLRHLNQKYIDTV